MAKPKPWDSLLKLLVRVNPSDFVQWLVPGATFVKEQPYDLESQKREVDALLEVVVDGQHVLLHIEFQTYNDATMAERLLLYNVLARSVYTLPVLSCVIYLLKDGTIRQSPLIIMFPGDKKVLEFHFQSIEIGKFAPEDILSTGITSLVPLLPLTRNGTNRSVLQLMFDELKKQEARNNTEKQISDLEVIGYTLASLVLQRQNSLDLEWLIRRFREMHDIIRDTPIYQEILREGLAEGIAKGREEGREKGREEGREEGRLEASRRILLMATQLRFPNLATLAQEQAMHIHDEAILDDIISKIIAARSEHDVFVALRGWDNTFRA